MAIRTEGYAGWERRYESGEYSAAQWLFKNLTSGLVYMDALTFPAFAEKARQRIELIEFPVTVSQGEVGMHYTWNNIDDVYAFANRFTGGAFEFGAWLKQYVTQNSAAERSTMARDVAVVLGKHGGDRKSGVVRDQGSPTTLNTTGRGAAYLRARLQRDGRDELIAEVDAGRLSVKEAARAAGYVRPTWTAPADPERLASAIEKRLPGWKMVRAEAQAESRNSVAQRRVRADPTMPPGDPALTVYADPATMWPTQLRGPLDGAVDYCRWLAHLARQAKLDELWGTLEPTWEAFCEKRLGHAAAFVDAIIAGAVALGEEVSVSFETQYRADVAAFPRKGRRSLEQLEAQLRAMYVADVQRGVQEEYKRQQADLIAETKAERDAYMAKHLAVATMKASMSAILAEDDYRLLLNVLHPDRAPADRKDRFARAFDAVRKLDPYIKAVKA